MSMKRSIFFVPILFIFLSIGQTAPKNTISFDRVALKKLIDDIQKFGADFYSSDTTARSYFANGIKSINMLIEAFTILNSQYPDSNFDQAAFTYLEKKKNIQILNFYKQISSQNQMKDDFCRPTIFSMLNDSNAISKTGNKLLSYMTGPVDISDLQKNFLMDNEAILNYWIHESYIFVFILTADSLKIVKWDVPIIEIETYISKLSAPFYDTIDLLRLEFDTKISHQLYKYLFQPLEPHLEGRKIIYIIPDDLLIGFPFELLVCDTTIQGKSKSQIYYHQYSYINYLIKNYAISYNYSTAYFALIKGLDRTTKKLGRRLLTMSEPVIPKNMINFSNQISTISTQDQMVSDYAEDEVRRVSRLLFRHDNLKKEAVTKTYLFENGYNYRWLYFALPGILNNNKPLNSGILFSKIKNDSSSDLNWLSANESIQINLAADLLSLSATQLKAFNSSGNPGVMVLPQSFLFSGVKSVLFTLWRINSISTSQFMSKFYWELKYKRQTNALALQEAKIASMKDTFMYGRKEISRAHPYFWATFQLIGDPQLRPPSPTKIPPWAMVMIVYGIVFIISLYITRKTKPNRS